MADGKTGRKLKESIQILAAIGMPSAQQNERSALTLLSLAGMTPMMDWFREHYGKDYKPNTRETVRRQTVHQFVAAGLAIYNSDLPDRPVNSPKAVYQLSPDALRLLQAFGTEGWEEELARFLEVHGSLASEYAKDRDRAKIPLRIRENLEIQRSPGQHSRLIRDIVEEFGPRFAPGSELVYVGDTGDKWGYADEELLAKFGIPLSSHGKMPDVVLYDRERDWLFLVESVTSHGPMDGKRIAELKTLFWMPKRYM